MATPTRIRILNGPYRGRERTVDTAKGRFTIGRDAEATVQILDRGASRFHCELIHTGGMWFVRDLDSKNGTHVNDERLADEELLRHGDIIRIGKTELAFENGAALASDDSSARISYEDDPELLSHTLEFKIDELSDVSEPAESPQARDQHKGLRILYQVARILAENPGDGEARALDMLNQAMPAEAGLIFLKDPVSGKLVPSVVRTAMPHAQPVISRSIVKKTFTENKALHSADAREDGRFDRHASIHAKDIRSVLCVPLVVSGRTAGVLYLSRGPVMPSFDQVDLELASAVVLQIGQHRSFLDERHRQDDAIDHCLAAWAAVCDQTSPGTGVAAACARTAGALARAMGLDADGQRRLRRAGWLHRAVGTPPRLAAFAARSTADPAADPAALIAALGKEPGLDGTIVLLLQGCHLDGSLYQ